MQEVRAMIVLLLGWCFALTSASGCVTPSVNFLAASKTESREHLIHLPGIAGEQNLDRHFIRGLRAGGCVGTLEVYDWAEKAPALGALFARKRNERQADKIAEKIQQILNDEPGVKLRIVC